MSVSLQIDWFIHLSDCSKRLFPLPTRTLKAGDSWIDSVRSPFPFWTTPKFRGMSSPRPIQFGRTRMGGVPVIGTLVFTSHSHNLPSESLCH
jgi:hypothetical protein